MELNRAMKRALVSLGALAVFGVVLAIMVAQQMPVTKEFVGTLVGGLVPLITLVYSAQAKDDAKKAREGSERAEHEARKTEADKTLERQ